MACSGSFQSVIKGLEAKCRLGNTCVLKQDVRVLRSEKMFAKSLLEDKATASK